MLLIGILHSHTKDNRVVSTLYVEKDFEEYYRRDGRECSGKMTDSIYVGDYDVSGLSIGDNIRIYYGKAIGKYQPVEKIVVQKPKA